MSAEPIEAVPAAEANRRFSALLRGVREGRRYVVTSHGRPVAELVPPSAPVDEDAERADRLSRLEAYFAEARKRPIENIGRWSRDEVNDRELERTERRNDPS